MTKLQHIDQLISNNQVPIVIVSAIIGFCVCVGFWSGPEAVVSCPDGSTAELDIPVDLDIRSKAELITMFTIPVMCGESK